ncbi:uncharacterized protein [Malus domestica]|uniref:uncharacterized protein isoform X2 n=1 Tax=Malus domestica TaxID=3750 RepID=UPI003976FE2C
MARAPLTMMITTTAMTKPTKPHPSLTFQNPPPPLFLPYLLHPTSFLRFPDHPSFSTTAYKKTLPQGMQVLSEGGMVSATANFRRKRKIYLPVGAVVESKAHLVGIHERVRSDFEGKQPPTSVVTSTAEGAKRVPTATNPSAEDAAALLRMCLQCGIPKTYSNARGMVCPTCGDRPVDPTNDSKKKGSTVKDKEKSKRMKGQSSHATWKSETEMHLRQQFD